MKKQYPYSTNKEFLNKIDLLHVREQWVKITLLEYNSEIPISDIEGRVISGSISKTGDSTVRRTCNLSCAIDAFKYNIDDIKADYSISKKIYLELGVTNTTNEYVEEEIIWFPQGIFFITSCAITTSSAGAATVNLQFKDKMAQLDGTVGGVFPATVRFDTVSSIINGEIITNKTLVYDIIMEVVNHFGGEDISNIIIDDIPKKAKRIIRWNGLQPIWIYPILGNNGEISYDICFASDLDEKQSAYKAIISDSNTLPIAAKEYQAGQDIGYMYEDFVYDQELTFKAGAKVTDVLDTIKKWLGNYEYFYDEWGQFHFQEIKNYLNNSQSAEIWEKIIETDDTDYLYESTHGKTVYTFDDSINLISVTNTPVYENIKNDFIVEGTVTNNNIKHTCRYHLVIDDKPTITEDGFDNTLIYEDPLTNTTTIAKPKIITPTQINNQWKWLLPEFAEDGKIYGLLDEPKIITYKKTLSDMNDFATYYDNLVALENSYIAQDITPITTEVKNYLFDLLERYMSYTDTTKYKNIYRDVIFTLVRQLRRYNVDKKTPDLSSTSDYYEALYAAYILDKTDYGSAVIDKISWCGWLLQLLYDSFNNIATNSSHKPINGYIDTSYWPAINVIIENLWANMASSNDPTTLKALRKTRCLEYINAAKTKQIQLKVLSEQYGQIVNDYNIQIELQKRNNASASAINQLITARDAVQNQIDNYQQQQEICGERLTILYAILTALGSSDNDIGETYYTVDININVRMSSFWYYNKDSNEEKYGWNELVWYQYYRNKTNATSYYPNGLGSMTYINFSEIDLGNTNYYPSMNRYSLWYQSYYIEYAADHDLPYFNNDKPNVYIPTNWRTELLLRGLRAEENGTDPGPYYQELKANWPTVYDFKGEQIFPSSINYIDYFVGNTGVILGSNYEFTSDKFNAITAKAKFKPNNEAEIKDFLLNYENGNYYYFFDMIDSSSSEWGEYSVNNIGRRTNVTVSDSVNCIFAPKIPDYAFVNVSGLTWQERRDTLTELADIAEDIIQITDIFNENFSTGGYRQSAYSQIRYDLQQYTSYQNTVSITAIPCFYLEPNVRVKLNDHSTGTFGDYVIKSISIPLGMGGNMSVSMSKAMERI